MTTDYVRWNKEIQERLDRSVKQSPVLQREIAAAVNLTEKAVSGWMRGKAQPSLAHFAKVCQMAGVSADEVLGIAPTHSEIEEQRTMAEGELQTIKAAIGALESYVDSVGRPVSDDARLQARVLGRRGGP